MDSQIRVATLSFLETAPFRALTFPGYQQTLWRAGHTGSVVAIGAWAGATPIGLALAVPSEQPGLHRVASLAVLPEYRGRGVGKALLDAMIGDLRRRGTPQLEIGWRSGTATAIAVTRMLADGGWADPVRDRLLCHCDRRMLEADWLYEDYPLPDDQSIVPWHDVTVREKAALIASQLLDPWVPASLNPMKYNDNAAFNSVALRTARGIAGWVITERFDARTLIYSCSYMRPDLARLGRIVALYAEAIRHHGDVPSFDRARWAVPYKHPAMVRFVKRRMTPFATMLEDFMTAQCDLAGAA